MAKLLDSWIANHLTMKPLLVELSFVILVATFVLGLVIFPFILGNQYATTNLKFTGISRLNWVDTNTYLAWIQQAREGKWLFQNLYTSEAHPQIFFRPEFLILGRLAEVFQISNILAFVLGKIIFGFFLLVVIYLFCGLFFEAKSKRKIAFLLTVASSGLGWLLGSIIPRSIDLWLPEAFTFLSIYNAPHFALAQALLILTFFFFWKRQIFLAGFSALFLSFIHPFDVFVVWLTLGIYFLFQHFSDEFKSRQILKNLKLVIFFSLPGLIYQFALTRYNPVAQGWTAQNILKTPFPWEIVVGYGLVFFLSLWGIKSGFGRLLLAWILAVALLIYLPFPFQRRFLEGVYLPLSLLAAAGLFKLLENLSKEKFLGLSALVIFIASLSNLTILEKDLADYWLKKYPFYLTGDQVEAMEVLKKEPKCQAIFSSMEMGYFIPALTGKQVFLGHKIQTISFEEKSYRVLSFLNTDEEGENPSKGEFLKKEKIDCLFYGPYEKLLGSFQPETRDYLEPIYQNKTVTIYQVQ